MANGILIPQCRAEYSENIMPEVAMFEDTGATITKASGTAGSTAGYSTAYHFDGLRSIQSYNDSTSTPLVWNLGSELAVTIGKTGTYIFSIKLMQIQNPLQYVSNQMNVGISVNGSFTKSMDITLPVTDPDSDGENLATATWYTFGQSYIFNAGEIINFKFTHVTHPSAITGDSLFYVDSLQLEFDDRLLGRPSIYSKPLV